ncbi:P22 phage major capsid protein family protein [Rhizobium johnstonii]|uniref:P22 phage major capsid protein family protein n=1 Tax=Rhizobium johnstonii TaxID=3019933 RepID=UPI003F99BE38
MANSVAKQVSVFAKESLKILENTLVMTKKVYVDLDTEFTQTINGYKKGDTVSIKRPADFTVRDGAVRSVQDVVEGSTTMTINKQKGVDVNFTSKELTLDIDESGVRERVLKPAMIQLANQVDMDIMALYKDVPSWVGTPGNTINSYADFSKAPERMDELAVLQNDRTSVLSPADYWGMLGSQTGLYINQPANDAYRMAKLGMIGDVDTYMSQNVPTHTTGVGTGSPTVNGASQDVTYLSVKDTYQSSLITTAWTASTTGIVKQGDIITIAGVFAVNPVTKATLPFLRQFVVKADVNSAGAGAATLTLSPPIIASGSQQTVSAAPANGAAITFLGTGATNYRQNLFFHKNAFAFTAVPMEMPAAVYNGSRQSYKGISIRLIPVYDSTNDVAGWRYDILYGVKTLDARLATRASGTP